MWTPKSLSSTTCLALIFSANVQVYGAPERRRAIDVFDSPTGHAYNAPFDDAAKFKIGFDDDYANALQLARRSSGIFISGELQDVPRVVDVVNLIVAGDDSTVLKRTGRTGLASVYEVGTSSGKSTDAALAERVLSGIEHKSDEIEVRPLMSLARARSMSLAHARSMSLARGSAGGYAKHNGIRRAVKTVRGLIIVAFTG
eukprot:CFRG5239T1